MRRRDVLTLLGGAAVAWPSAARAQQAAMPTVGFLVGATRQGYAEVMSEVHQGLKSAGYVEGRNLAVEYRFADEQYDRLPALVADLVQRRVAAIFVTGSIVSALVAKAATSTIPVVFAMGSDPVKYGLVASLSRPGGNVTGVTYFNSALAPKRIELLHEMLPKATLIAMLVNPSNPSAESDTRDAQEAARTIGLSLLVLSATSAQDLDAAFSTIRERGAEALIVHNDTLFQSRHPQIIALAVRHAVPAMWTGRRFTVAGGLVSYGTNTSDMNREAGVYVGRILKDAKPAELPVLQPTRFELVVNLKAAKAMGLTVPPQLLARADEVIE